MRLFKNRYLHKIENWWIRLTTGAGCCDTYSLYYYLAPKIVINLKRFKERQMGYPAKMSESQWDLILDKMIYAFDAVSLDDNGEEVDYIKMQEGFELFGKHYRDLWY